MKYLDLRREVVRVNREIVSAGLVVLTWGNASAADRKAGVMAIKPSGVDYEQLKPEDVVVLALADGHVIEGKLRPSSDTPTHLYLYQQFSDIGGIVHTHSLCATAWAQAGRAIPCLGTTHADHFHGTIPVARRLTKAEVAGDYELNTGVAIVDTFHKLKLDPLHMPGILIHGHAPFVWGRTARTALDNAISLEAVAGMAQDTLAIAPRTRPLTAQLLNKHFLRKHGSRAYYGQV